LTSSATWGILLPFCAALGWLVGLLVSRLQSLPAYLAADVAANGIILGLIVGAAIGGAVTVRGLRQAVPQIGTKHALIGAVGWALAMGTFVALTFLLAIQ
jgi:hypothetical protein